MQPNRYFGVPTGATLFRNSGELAFELATNMGEAARAGTFPCVFLEPVGSSHCKVINERGLVQVVRNSLLSRFNI